MLPVLCEIVSVLTRPVNERDPYSVSRHGFSRQCEVSVRLVCTHSDKRFLFFRRLEKLGEGESSLFHSEVQFGPAQIIDYIFSNRLRIQNDKEEDDCLNSPSSGRLLTPCGSNRLSMAHSRERIALAISHFPRLSGRIFEPGGNNNNKCTFSAVLSSLIVVAKPEFLCVQSETYHFSL